MKFKIAGWLTKDGGGWRLLNMLRGKYCSAFGNTPGHLQHWSKRRFVTPVSTYFDILEVKTPFPWIMLLCQRK